MSGFGPATRNRAVLAIGIAASLTVAGSSARAQYPEPPGLGAAIRSASKSDRELKAFYAQRSHRPLWYDGSDDGAADALLHLIEDADLDGIDPRAFDIDALADGLELFDGGSAKAIAKADLAFTRAFVRYAGASRRARDVGMVYLDRELSPRPPSVRALLEDASAAPSLHHYVASQGWMNPVYADLRRGLAANRDRGAGAAPLPVPEGAMLRIGASGYRVEALRQRLGLAAGGPYDQAVAAQVAAFQAASGIPADGVAGPRTLLALNDVPQDREAQIRLNMERARILPVDPGRRYILVDAAGARLWLYENGRVRDTMKVIVGKPAQPTPMLAGLMHYAIVNPYWNIPPDLTRDKVAPEVLRKGVRYLKAMRYEVLSDWTDAARVVDPKTIDWASVAAGGQEVRVRQLPGKNNSMGKVKFVLPNDMGIYLHDTPDKALFEAADRHLSAGCVRVEDAQRLARWLYGKPLAAPSSAPEQRVELPEPVPVYITYLTAAPTAGGIVFRSDPYGRDRSSSVRYGSRGASNAGAR